MTSEPNYLMLVHRFPYPPNRGDRIRSYHLLKHLASRGKVHLATFADEPVAPESLEVLRSLCANVFVEPLGASRWLRAGLNLALGKSATEGLFQSSRLGHTVQRWAASVRFDAVVVFCSSMVQYLHNGLRGIPTIVDLVDVDSQKFFDYAARSRVPKRWLYKLEGSRLRAVERNVSRRAKALTLVSEAEAGLYRSICPNSCTYAVGNGVDSDYFAPRQAVSRKAHCVFVGVMDYPPNIEAVIWFCRNVWPLVRAAYPDATFTIVGRNPVPQVRSLSSLSGVEVVPSVPDVRPYLAAASAVVVPLKIARGVQNKVLEAMAMAKPVIVSPQAREGLEAEPGIHLLEAETQQEWVHSLDRVFSDTAFANQLGQAGFDYVQDKHLWPVCLATFDRLLEPRSLNHELAARQS